MDTQKYDDQINILNTQLASAQTELDNDIFTVQLNASQEKSRALNVLKNQISEISNKKARAIEIQDKIEELTAEFASLDN